MDPKVQLAFEVTVVIIFACSFLTFMGVYALFGRLFVLSSLALAFSTVSFYGLAVNYLFEMPLSWGPVISGVAGLLFGFGRAWHVILSEAKS